MVSMFLKRPDLGEIRFDAIRDAVDPDLVIEEVVAHRWQHAAVREDYARRRRETGAFRG